MTSGIRDYATQIGDSREDFDEAKLLRCISGFPPDFAPGEKWAYCNSNYVLLGRHDDAIRKFRVAHRRTHANTLLQRRRKGWRCQ